MTDFTRIRKAFDELGIEYDIDEDKYTVSLIVIDGEFYHSITFERENEDILFNKIGKVFW
jgi:hypothetical protein